MEFWHVDSPGQGMQHPDYNSTRVNLEAPSPTYLQSFTGRNVSNYNEVHAQCPW